MTEAKGEILRESSGISPHLFKQPLGRHTIEVREIAIENNLNASYRMDEGKWRNGRGHGGCVSWQLLLPPVRDQPKVFLLSAGGWELHDLGQAGSFWG